MTALPRQGPRPLPLHLTAVTAALLSSRAAWLLSKSGLLPWKESLAERAQNLLQSLAAVAPDDFAAALDAEIYARTDAFLTGLERYRRHPYRRRLTDPPVLWQEGTTRLLDYGPPGAAPVLVVPSLINRAYILDLAPGNSLLRHLAGAGLRPLLVDWGRPGEAERGFTLDDYIAGRLEQAAMELFIERGFEQTTVTEIATRAGLTQRTFFRYFADKREVLFWGAGALQELLVSTVASAPDGTAPIDAVATALEAVGPVFAERREYSRRRQAGQSQPPECEP